MTALSGMLQLAGMFMSASGSIREGNAMSASEMANANIASSQARQVRRAGEHEETKIARAKRQTLAMQRARYAKSGVLFTEGSPVEVMADTAAQYEMDILTNRYNTDVEAGRYEYESQYRKGMSKRYKSLGYTKAISGVLLSAGKHGASYGSKTPANATNGKYWNQSYLDNYFKNI